MKIGFLQMTVERKWQARLIGGYKNQIRGGRGLIETYKVSATFTYLLYNP